MGNEFYFINNETAATVQELKKGIENLKYSDFIHHVGYDHNHFANWLEDVHNDKETAKKLRSTISKNITIKVLEEKLQPTKHKVSASKHNHTKSEAKTHTHKEKESHNKTHVHKKSEKDIAHNVKKNLHLKHKLPKHPVSYVSTDSPEKFVLKEFLMGALFGLILGFVLMAMATNAGL